MQFIQPGPYDTAAHGFRHYLVGFLSYLVKHGPQIRIEVDPVDDERSSQEENNDVKEFRVGARHVEAKIAGEWTEIKHCYAWDNVVCENFDVNGNGEAVHPTRRTVVFSCEL